MRDTFLKVVNNCKMQVLCLLSSRVSSMVNCSSPISFACIPGIFLLAFCQGFRFRAITSTQVFIGRIHRYKCKCYGYHFIQYDKSCKTSPIYLPVICEEVSKPACLISSSKSTESSGVSSSSESVGKVNGVPSLFSLAIVLTNSSVRRQLKLVSKLLGRDSRV
jgi:hypothetical protein